MKQRANLSAIGQQLGETTQSYIVAPLISAPNSNIRTLSGATRQIPDPSKTLKPAMGIERVTINTIIQKQDEVGSNGERVYEIESKDSRIRLVGLRWAVDSAADNNGTKAQSNNVGDYVEVTFYGTGLNILTHVNSTNNTLQVSVDGGAASTILTGAYSAALNATNFLQNAIVNAASGLSLGVHTIRITLTAGTFFIISGVEILNTSSVTNIIAPKGAVVANGIKYNIGTDQTFAYATGFDGNPSLNGRGGKVVVYATPEGRVGKVIQQVDSSSLTNTSTNHANEELIRKINWREFGANRADDFSTLSTARAASFVLSDGTTVLSADSAVGQVINSIDSFFLNGTGNFFNITFVGTGLDLFQTQSSVARDLTLTIDGVSAGTIAAAQLLDRRIVKVVSGLPYGTHTVRFTQSAGGTGPTFSDLYIYGPKTPTLPDNAVKIAEYNLMATYQASATAGVTANSAGVMAKHNLREVIYANGTGGTQDWTFTANIAQSRSGFTVDTNRSGAYVECVFWGTGFDLRPNTDPSISGASTLSLNGLTLNSTNFPTATSSVVGGATFSLGTGIMTQSAATSSGNIISVRNLPLGLYRFRQTSNSAAFIQFGGIDIITPIHIPANKTGSMSIADLDLINKSANKPALDLSKAKAWIVYNQSSNIVLSSFGVAAALANSTGRTIFYWEKPFKSANYAVQAISFTDGAFVFNSNITASYVEIGSRGNDGTFLNSTYLAVIAFGEQVGE